jgi:hypothetical protein
MFDFDFVLLTGFLIAVMIPVYVLILKKLRPRSMPTNKNVANGSKESETKRRKKDIIIEEKMPETIQSKRVQANKSDATCFHSFGYLRTLPRNASLPDECLGCPKIMECLTHD